MKYRRTVGGFAALATVVSSTALVALASPSYAGSVSGPDFLTDTIDKVGGGADPVVKLLEGSTGAITGIEAEKSPIPLPEGAVSTDSPESIAKSHLDRFASKLGVRPDALEAVSTSQVPGGDTVKFQQYLDGLPVVAGELVTSATKAGELQAIVGETAKGVVEETKGLLGEAKAEALATRYVAKHAKVSVGDLSVENAGRWIYNPSLLGAPGPAVNREVFKLAVADSTHTVDYTVFVDRGFGSVALAMSNNHEALNRKVCDLNNQDAGTFDGVACDGSTVDYARQEGGAAAGVPDADSVFDKLGETAKWYANYTDVDVTALIGTDTGDGKALRATTRACATEVQQGCPLENAFWSDTLGQMVYGEGYTTQDITSHELTHGVTSATSGLYYAYQSGAINESMSDIFGELIDLAANPAKGNTDAAWIIGDDAPTGPIRNMKDPTAFEHPDTLTSDLWVDDVDFEDDGAVHFNNGPGNKAAYLIAQGDSFNGYDVRGLGLAKTFKIYWTAENLLSSGADYKDLFHVLPLSCRKNVGRAGTHITEDDCVQVDKAVRATEMYEDASSGAPVATPYCPNNGDVDAAYSQTFDATPSDWTLEGGAGLTVDDFAFDYVNTGQDALGLFTEEGRVDAGSATSEPIEIPMGAQLRIDYSTLFSLYAPADGASAELEYSINDGATWLPATTLLGAVDPGPWTGHSYGWSSAKYDLTALSGQNAQFRFSIDGTTGDDTNPVSLFTLDNFKIYTC